MCLAHSKKTRVVLFFSGLEGWEGGQSGFYPSVLLVSQNLLQMESEISAPETDLFAFFSEVVTLTFPLAHVILLTLNRRAFSADPVLIGAQEFSNFKSFF